MKLCHLTFLKRVKIYHFLTLSYSKQNLRL
jgi:hypothetical protein